MRAVAPQALGPDGDDKGTGRKAEAGFFEMATACRNALCFVLSTHDPATRVGRQRSGHVGCGGTPPVTGGGGRQDQGGCLCHLPC